MNSNKRLILFLIGITIALIWIFLKSEHRRHQVFRGYVVKKYSVKKWVLKGRRVKDLYFLEVKTSDGKVIEVDVPFSLYSKVRVGDRVVKLKGEKVPRILSSSSAESQDKKW